VAACAESLCCTGARSVVEVTREVTVLRGKDKGKSTRETVLYVSSLEFHPPQADQLLGFVRLYWDIESGLHQRLDVSAREDASRVRNPNAILVLGIARRATFGLYHQWRRRRKRPRQSTLRDFHDAMDRFNHRLAFSQLQPPRQ
jgi:predicted transposase YbfD/YdcC